MNAPTPAPLVPPGCRAAKPRITDAARRDMEALGLPMEDVIDCWQYGVARPDPRRQDAWLVSRGATTLVVGRQRRLIHVIAGTPQEPRP